MRDLILLDWNSWNYLNDSETYTVAGSHPITANLPPSFTMPFNAHTYGVARPGTTTLITGTSSNDAVVVKEIGSGRVVEYAWANDFIGTTWTPELEQLFVDSVIWAMNTNIITATPTSGATIIANQTDVTVTADSYNFSEGTYSGSFTITSNDLDETPLLVPVTITVDDTNPVVSFESPTPANSAVLSAGTGTVTINVSITESNPDSLILNWNDVNESHVYGPEWSITKNVSNGGNYTYYVWVNDTADNVNTTETRTFSVSSGGGGGSGSGGGGGGGGGGASGEAYENIKNIEQYEMEIYKDISTNYHFNKNGVIEDINITGNVNAGLINVKVEVLRDTSTLVNESAPGNVYKNVNIWVGSAGFAVPKNIKEATIKFSVNQNWLDENGIREVTIYRYTDNKWVQLPTKKIGDETGSVIYSAATNHFSSYAISGFNDKNDKVRPQTASEKSESTITQTVTDSEDTTKGDIVGILAALTGLALPKGNPAFNSILMVVGLVGIVVSFGVLRRRMG